MRKLSDKEIKDIQIKLMDDFHRLCIGLGLRYSLGGGSLLGAIRHRGYIPWDDDIDVIMPRPDFDKLAIYNKNHKLPFIFMTHESVKGYNNLHGKVVDEHTVIKDKYIDSRAIKMGVNIDIFPIDGLGNNYNDALKTFKKTEIKREILNARTWKKFFRSHTHPWYYEPARLLIYFISRLYKAEDLMVSIDKINREKNFDNVKYAGCVCGSYRTKEILKQKIFSEYEDVYFEGRVYKGLKAYDEYLSSLYGAYMKMPPEDKRITHHTFKAYLAD